MVSVVFASFVFASLNHSHQLDIAEFFVWENPLRSVTVSF